MANPLFQRFRRSAMNPMAQLVADAKRLQQTMTGNPKQMVEELVKSGTECRRIKFNSTHRNRQSVIGGGAFK